MISAVENALAMGTSFGAPTELETEMAELVIELVPSVEMVRMVSSGTEATMSAIRLARGHTQRDVIIKFAGCYHGHVDSLLVQAGSGALTHGVPSSPGVPAGCTADTIALEYNNPQQLADTFQARGDEIACVILEPVVGNMGVVAPEPGFLETARELCTKHGALLIFDEVMTGFRVALGGAQQRFGVTPDLTTLGKILGGGMPVGAYGGRAEVMRSISPVGPVYQAGTLSGNPLAMACGLATLRELQESNPYEQLETRTARLVQGLSEAATAAGIPHQTAQVGSMFTLFFNPEKVVNYTHLRQERHPAICPLFLGHAQSRHLSALQPIRGQLRLHHPHGSDDRPNPRRRPGGVSGVNGFGLVRKISCARKHGWDPSFPRMMEMAKHRTH